MPPGDVKISWADLVRRCSNNDQRSDSAGSLASNQIERANEDEPLLILPTKLDFGGSARPSESRTGSTVALGTNLFPGRVKDVTVDKEERSV